MLRRQHVRHAPARTTGRLLLAGAALIGVVGTLGTRPQPASAATLQSWYGDVVSIVDGDTVEVVLDGQTAVRTVRIAGLNTNERWEEDPRPAECHAAAAKAALVSLLDGERVRLAARSASSQDKGRDLRHVFIGSSNVAQLMLEDGYGLPIQFTLEPDYAAANTAAAWRGVATGSHLWDPDACGAGPGAVDAIEMVTNYDAAGDDTKNPNGEYVQLRNTGGSTIDLTGWQLRDTGLGRWTFPAGASLPAGGRIRIYVGAGTNTSTSFYLGHSVPMLANTYDGMFLHDTQFDIRAYDMWPCSGDCGPTPPLVIDRVSYDAPGDDSVNPNGEWVRIRNVGNSTVDLQDWVIDTPPYQATSIASRPMAPGGSVVLYLGAGTGTTDTMYYGLSTGVLGNTGDIVTLLTPDRDLVDCAAWGSYSCGAGTESASRIEVTLNWDAAGDDATNPNGEWVNLRNTTSRTVDVSGFRVVAGSSTYTFPAGSTIAAGSRLRLYVGSGTASSTARYWGQSGAIFANAGGSVALRDASNVLVRSFTYPCSGLCGADVEPFVIDRVVYNAPGDDASNPNGERIVIRNVASYTVDLRDWQVQSGSYQLNFTASRRIASGSVVTVYVGTGTSTTGSVYWGKSGAILANSGGSVRLVSPARDLADCEAWGTGSCTGDGSSSGVIGLTAHFDAEGDDTVNPNGEWVNVSNTGSDVVDLTGWTLESAGRLFRFGGSELEPGERIRVRIGSGSATSSTVYWGQSAGILTNTGGTAALYDDDGLPVRSAKWLCTAACAPVPSVDIDSVQWDAAGDDSANPNGEWVVIANNGATPVDLRDWTVVTPPYVFDFSSSYVIQPGATVTVRMGSGTRSGSTFYWGFSTGVLGNTGDLVQLWTPANDLADCSSWGSSSC